MGVGTRLANGCTSGHGICGIGRFSKRSIVATCVFMAVAAVTVFVRLHLM
ncbi:transmembrane protein [Vibrio cholerae]|nr:transmembrane protein [Vibrio cholerae]